jgi:NADH-quinone oxidoreductase subunit N
VFIMINVLAVASMLAGNLLALLQNNVKRILAYSSIAHLGYLLVAFLAGGALAKEAVTYYLVAYFVMTLGAFGIVTVLSSVDGETEVEELADYRGLLWQRPWLGGVFTITLLALAGIPLTVGFFAKFYAVAGGVGAAAWPAIFALVAGSVIGLFYYLRVIVIMATPVAEAEAVDFQTVPWTGGATLAALTFILIWLGLYPAPLISLIRLTALQVGN